MLEIGQKLKPERVIIEPTGVATISQIQSIISAELFEEFIDDVHNILVVDATGFMQLFKANPHFVESQVKNAHLALLNKCDLVDNARAKVTQNAVLAINPDITVLMTEFGAVDWADYTMALSTASSNSKRFKGVEKTSLHDPDALPMHNETPSSHVHREEDGLGHESFGFSYEDGCFDQQALINFFETLKAGRSEVGEVVRAKGIFQIEEGWILIELASGQVSFQPIKRSDTSKLLVIGKQLQKESARKALEGCLISSC